MTEGYGLVQIISPRGGFVYDLGLVEEVTDNLSKSVSTVPIVNMPTDRTFALESGTSDSYRIRFSRRTPLREDGTTYEDSPGYPYCSWMWTNRDWCARTSTVINRWQMTHNGFVMTINISRNPDGTEVRDITGAYSAYPGLGVVPYNPVLPVVRKNVFIRSVGFTQTAGDTDYISGEMTVVVGGIRTLKLGTNTGDRSVRFPAAPRTTVLSMRAYQVREAGAPPCLIPGHPVGGLEYLSYNLWNEYNETIANGGRRAVLTLSGADGLLHTVPLLEGRSPSDGRAADGTTSDGSGARLDYERDTWDAFNIISSYTITGGPSRPFEEIYIRISLNRMGAQFGDLVNGTPVSVYVNAVGCGEYTVTGYSVSSNVMTCRGYCPAYTLESTGWEAPESYMEDTAPELLVKRILTDPLFLKSPYTPDRIVSNMDLRTPETYPIVPRDGTSLWKVLWNTAMIAGCRIFLTSSLAYVVDYTRLTDIDDDDGVYPGNKLWIRDGLDKGIRPVDWALTPGAREMDSLALQTTDPASRLSGRVVRGSDVRYSADQTIYNHVTVVFPYGGHRYEARVGTYYPPSKVAPAKVETVVVCTDGGPAWEQDIDRGGTRDSILARCAHSSERRGVMKGRFDLTDTYSDLHPELAVRFAFAELSYHLENLVPVSFPVREDYSSQKDSDSHADNEAFWSAAFPTVCAVKRFTDRSQDMEVSSFREGCPAGTSPYRPETTFLTSYERRFPDAETVYTFGEVTPVTLANTIQKSS